MFVHIFPLNGSVTRILKKRPRFHHDLLKTFVILENGVFGIEYSDKRANMRTTKPNASERQKTMT